MTTEPVVKLQFGQRSAFGNFSIGDLSVPAFGPQGLPLSDPKQFGILQNRDGWANCAAERAAWIHFDPFFSPNHIRLNFQAIGNEQMKIVFYAQARTCAIQDGPILHPGELRNFEGIAKKIVINQNIELCSKQRCQIIPLSKTECFWNASFLIVFEFSKTRSLFDRLDIEFSC